DCAESPPRGIVGQKPNRRPVRISRGPSGLEIGDATCHIAPMGQPQRDYRYRLRKYPRRHGVVWRWFIFEGDSGPVETGIVLEPDRDKAETAVKAAIERLRRMPPRVRVERSAGAEANNDAAGQASAYGGFQGGLGSASGLESATTPMA